MSLPTLRRRPDGVPPGDTHAFAAFLSYSHAADNRFAPALQGALHQFAKPWYRLRAIRIFRDESTLSTTPGLWSAISGALAASRYFVLLASPDAAASHWVAREVAYWCAERGTASLLIVLTDGDVVWDETRGDFDWERTTALPPVLRGAFHEEPLYLDFRALAHEPGRLSLRDHEFRERVADLAATLHDRPRDELLGEDVHQHALTRRWIRAAVTTLVLLLLIAVVMAVVALVQRNEAREQARTATSRLLAAEAVAEDRIDRSLLLALASWELEAGPQARGALAEVLARDARAVRVLQGRGRVDSVAFSPDGQRLAATGRDGTVTVWEQLDGGPRVLAVAELSGEPLRCLAFSPDGSTLAVGGNDGHVRLWDISAQRISGPAISASSAPVLSVTFTGDGRRILTGSEDGVARLWDRDSRTEVARTVSGHPGGVTVVAANPDGSLFATGGADMAVRLWRSDSLEPVGPPLKGHSNWVSSLAFRPPNGAQLVSAGQDGSIVVWDVATGRQVGAPVDTGAGRLRDLAFSPHGTRLYSVGEDRTVRQWDVDRRRQQGAALGGVGGPLFTVAVRPQDDLVATGGDDGTVVLWSAQAPTSPIARPLLGGASGVTGVVFVSGGRQLATAQLDGTVVLWDARSRHPLGPSLLTADPGRRPLLATDARGELLAISGPRDVQIWNVEQRSVLRTIPTSGVPSAVSLSRDGRRLAVAVGVPEPDSRVDVWDVGTGQRISPPLTAQRRSVNALAFSPDDARVAAATHDSAVVVWDVDAGTQLPARQGRQAGQVTAVSFVSNHVVASGADDGSIVLTDTETGRAVGRRMAGHDGRVRAVASAPQPGLLVSGGEDGRVVLWDLDTQTRLGRAVVTFGGRVADVEASPDGGTVVSAGPGGTVLTLTAVDTWREEACRVAGRELDEAEWSASVGEGFQYQPVCNGPAAADDD